MSDQIPHFLRRDSNGLEIRSIQSEKYWIIALYADISDRMMSLAAGLGYRQEVYSIDESWVDLTGIRGDLTHRSHRLRERTHPAVDRHSLRHWHRSHQDPGQTGELHRQNCRAQAGQLPGKPCQSLQPGRIA